MNRITELLNRKRQQVESLKSVNPQRSIPEENRLLNWDREQFRIIAELKRASLSAGSIRPDLQPDVLARNYEHAGAAALSVLTEENFFHGSIEDLRKVRNAVSLPLLQKDFILDEIQIDQAKQAGASFVLLIARFLEKSRLADLAKYAEENGMNALVEITNLDDLKKIYFPVRYLGVNSRDLDTLEVDIRKFETLRSFLPDAFLIAESGIANIETMRDVIQLGYHGALIGEHFLRCPDPAAELSDFVKASMGGTKTRPRIKICGITSKQDAMLAIDAGASALGFIFVESPRRISPEILKSFRDRIPESILCVGVFRGQSNSEINETIQRYDLHVAQIYDDVQLGFPVWKARTVQSVSDFEEAGDGTQMLWDLKADGPELIDLWNEASKRKIFALAGGLHSGNVAKAVRLCKPEWVDVARGVERSPGIKDEAQLRAFIKELS